jgi:hypothetical protein
MRRQHKLPPPRCSSPTRPATRCTRCQRHGSSIHLHSFQRQGPLTSSGGAAASRPEPVPPAQNGLVGSRLATAFGPLSSITVHTVLCPCHLHAVLAMAHAPMQLCFSDTPSSQAASAYPSESVIGHSAFFVLLERPLSRQRNLRSA